MHSNSHANDSPIESLERLGEYKAMVTRLFPSLSKAHVDEWGIPDRDALAWALFLDRFPPETVVLEVGTFVGVSTFHLAGQPKVSKVVSVDLNPSMADILGLELSPDVRPLDVAEATLAHFPEYQRKVQLKAGTTADVSIPKPESDGMLVAFVDGDHGKEFVEADLQAIFEKNPRTVVVLHDCLGRHAPAVLAGIAAFVEASRVGDRLGCHFRLFERLAPYSEPPSLGVLYPEALADQVERSTKGLLADSASSIFRAAHESWKYWQPLKRQVDQQWRQADKQRKRADKLEKQVEHQRSRADKLKKQVYKQRSRADKLKKQVEHQRSRADKLEKQRAWWRRVLGWSRAKSRRQFHGRA